MGIYMMGISVLLLAGTILSGLKKKKDLAQLKEKQPETLYAPSVRGEERRLYFLTDRGTAKFGHRIEDADRNVLYDAKVTKFSLTTPIGFVFTDHEHNRTTEQYLDLLFVTLMAFARTEANDGEGGNYGMLKSALGREK